MGKGVVRYRSDKACRFMASHNMMPISESSQMRVGMEKLLASR